MPVLLAALTLSLMTPAATPAPEAEALRAILLAEPDRPVFDRFSAERLERPLAVWLAPAPGEVQIYGDGSVGRASGDGECAPAAEPGRLACRYGQAIVVTGPEPGLVTEHGVMVWFTLEPDGEGGWRLSDQPVTAMAAG